MAAATFTATTSGTTVNKVWRKIQGKVAEGFQFMCEEYGWFEDWKAENIDWSHRETLVPLDINEEIGVATLPEGGYLARPSSVNMEEVSISLTQANARFSATGLAKLADKGKLNQVEDQLKYQAAKKVQAIGRWFADKVYGTAEGTIALTDSDLAGGTDTLTLYDAYGKGDIDNAAYIADKFRVGEYVAAVDSTTLVTDAIGVIGTVTAATPSIAITWIGSASATNNGLKIVEANNMENTTLAGTGYNRGLVGFIDVLETTTVHGLSGSSVPNWTAAFDDTAGSRLTTSRIQYGLDQIQNYGGGTGKKRLLVSQGVRRDLELQYSSLKRYDGSETMELAASVKYKGVEIKSTRRVPPQWAILYDMSSYRKVALTPKPDGTGGITWADGKEDIHTDNMFFSVDLVTGLFCRNRKNFGHWEALTESN